MPQSNISLYGWQTFTEELQREVIEYIKKTPFISGLTLSGGDPMYSASELVPFVTALKEDIKDISVWIYSGFSYEKYWKTVKC